MSWVSVLYYYEYCPIYSDLDFKKNTCGTLGECVQPAPRPLGSWIMTAIMFMHRRRP